MAQPDNYGFGEEAALLKESARKFFTDNFSTEKLHGMVASDHDPERMSACAWDEDLWRQMIELGYIRQRTDRDDRRVRRLDLSAKGKKLEHELTEVQRRRFADIFKQAGPAAEKHWREVMALLGEQYEF